MDLLSAVLILQQSSKNRLDPQSYFSRLFARRLTQSPGREPKYIEIYPGDLSKWTFSFVLAFLNELTEDWTKVGRFRRRLRSGQQGARMVTKWSDRV
jgi:hypothetical protein